MRRSDGGGPPKRGGNLGADFGIRHRSVLRCITGAAVSSGVAMVNVIAGMRAVTGPMILIYGVNRKGRDA